MVNPKKLILQALNEAQRTVEIVLPRTPFEAAVAFIWADVLGVEKVGVFDNYFELGGTSLTATQVISRVEDSFHVQLPMTVFFQLPTVANSGRAYPEYAR